MELCFILKRITEQQNYIESIIVSSIPSDRKELIIKSAVGQLEYFQEKLNNMNKSSLDKVTDFMILFNQRIGKIDELEPLENRQLGIKLMFEEACQELAEATDVKLTLAKLCAEYLQSCGALIPTATGPSLLIAKQLRFDSKTVDGNNVNKKEQLDSLVDSKYILLGRVNSAGLHEVFDQGFDMIHDNNMTKAHISQAHVFETKEKKNIHGKMIQKGNDFLLYDDNGKLTKPWDHKKVDLSHLVK